MELKNKTPLELYTNKLEDSILNFCKINETDYFDIRDLDKFQDKQNILDLVKLYYKLNGIVSIHIRKIEKIKPPNQFYNRNGLYFVRRTLIKENFDLIFDIQLRYRDIYLAYDGFYTLIEELKDVYRVKIFIREKMQIKFFFNKTGMYIACPSLKKCKFAKIKNINETPTCCKKTKNHFNKCMDVKLEYVEETAYPCKICISELYTIYNLYNLMETKIIKIKDSPDKKNSIRNIGNSTAIYIKRTEVRYTNPVKRNNLEVKKKRPHTRIGHWRTYKKNNKRVWINQIQINKKSDIKKINKTPYLL